MPAVDRSLELEARLIGLATSVADHVPRGEHSTRTIVTIQDASPQLAQALEYCGGRRLQILDDTYVDWAGPTVTVRTVERRPPARRKRS